MLTTLTYCVISWRIVRPKNSSRQKPKSKNHEIRQSERNARIYTYIFDVRLECERKSAERQLIGDTFQMSCAMHRIEICDLNPGMRNGKICFVVSRFRSFHANGMKRLLNFASNLADSLSRQSPFVVTVVVVWIYRQFLRYFYGVFVACEWCWVNCITLWTPMWGDMLTVKSTDKSVPSNRMTLHWIKFLFVTIRCGFIWLAVFWCCWPSVVATRFSPALALRPLRRLKNRSIFHAHGFSLFGQNSYGRRRRRRGSYFFLRFVSLDLERERESSNRLVGTYDYTIFGNPNVFQLAYSFVLRPNHSN